MATDLPSFDEFVDLSTLLPAVANMFPTEEAIRWYVRRNRAFLVEHGALILVAGRLRFHPVRFKAAAVTVGQRDAA